ncbi:MAG: M48 family metalloprotease [Pirellulaceae bacterium]|nr:M48 family metalloprotease [Pirellulaceae bacterium]
MTRTLNDLNPLPYHQAIRDYLKREEPKVWNWFASHRVRQEQIDAVRFELLKSTYRIDRETKPEWYEAAQQVAADLGLDVPVTIYQAQEPVGLNASLAFVPGEAHIVLHGPVASTLATAEFRALLAHELGHLLLWQIWDGDFLIVDQLLSALTHDSRAEMAHFATARLFALYNEIFCDRASLLATGGLLPAVAMLVKVSTGLADVSAESYLRQADEVFSRGGAKAADVTHPEAFIRARALRIWSEGDPDADRKTAEMIEGTPALDSLDLVTQEKVAGWTRRVIDAMLAPPWMQSESVLAHCRRFFDDYTPPAAAPVVDELSREIATDDAAMQDYYCFVLLDLVTADRDLEEMPLAAALVLTERLALKDRFLEHARRELRLRKRQLERIDEQKNELLAQAASGKTAT